jgi:hypothetical protein
VEDTFLTAAIPAAIVEVEKPCAAHFEHCCRALMDERAGFERSIFEASEGGSKLGGLKTEGFRIPRYLCRSL